MEYWSEMATPPEVVVARLALATALGAVLGLEREIHGRTAGLKTHMLIALAAATFTLLSLELFLAAKGAAGVDPIRVIEAVTTGVSVIAAGAILRSVDRIRGLTTGASLWTAGAAGIAVGAGYFVLAVAATVIAFLIITVLRMIQRSVE